MSRQLSVLIPVFNQEVVSLVQALLHQISLSGAEFEILLMDDQSDEEYKRQNAMLESIPHVKTYRLPSKAGRSVARNFLAAQAKYDYCLFIDCDSEIADDRFIERYLDYCNGEDVVVCGGTCYHEKQPETDRLLRWTYGVKNEVKPASIRNKRPNYYFQAFNFLIRRELFLQIRFNELLKNYGHEDTLFRFELSQRNINVIHIDNPLYHIGIDTNKEYLQKTGQGVENLKILMESPDSKELISHMRLLRYYRIFKQTRTVFVVFAVYFLLRGWILRNLNSGHPNMALFNFYKLGYLCSLKYNKI